YSEIAFDVWEELQETYDKMDGFVIFNGFVDEFDILTLLPACTCAAHKGVLKHNQLIRLMQFLMGLNDVYQNIRSNILARDPLPDVKEAFNVISREESHRGLHPGSWLIGHTIERCYKIIGYRAGFKRNPNLVRRGLNLIVGHLNGTLAKIYAIGNLRLTANVVLFDVLFVLEYNVILLSVHKLIKDRTGSESGGLYLFDVEQNGKSVVGFPLLSCLEHALTYENNVIYEGNQSSSNNPRSKIESQSNTNIGDEPQTLRKSNRVKSLPSKFNDFDVPINDSNGLGNLCGKHGTVVDAYLSKKLSKLGKRYAFVRFIKIDDVHSLIDNLRNIWIDSYKLFASSVIRDRFGNVIIDRQVPIQCNKVSSDTNFKAPIDKKLYKGSHDGPSYASVVEPKLKSTISKPANDPIELVSGDYVVSNEECDKVCLGHVKEFSSMPVLVDMCKAQGFLDLDIHYMGGMWVMMKFISPEACVNFRRNVVVRTWFKQLLDWSRDFVCKERLMWLDCDGLPVRAWSKANFCKLVSKWGNIVHIDDDLGPSLATTWICVETERMDIIAEEVLVLIDESVFVVRVREVSGWLPSFKEKLVISRDMVPSLAGDATDLDEEVNSLHSVHDEDALDNLHDSDPFSLSDLIRKEADKAKLQRMEKTKPYPMMPLDLENEVKEVSVDGSLSHPPGFTNEGQNEDRYVTVERGESCGSPFLDSVQQIPNQVSMVDGLDALIEMGYSMKGCAQDKLDVNFVAIQETKVSSIDMAMVRSLWGNTHFDYLHSDARGEIVVMGDFNEVRDASERFGTVFHEHTAHDFNQFIHDSDLVDVPLEKGIPDHYPILLREHKADYGPPLFCLFHSWMELDGFDDLVKDSWEVPVVGDSNAMIIFNKKLQSLKNNINNWNKIRRQTSEARKSQLRCKVEDIQNRVEDGSASTDDIHTRVHLIKQLRDIEHVENLDLAQKAKLLSDGGVRPTIVSDSFLKLSPNQITSLDAPFSCEEIKRALWDCGSDKAPGLDGFTFGFFKRFWEVIKEDVFAFVRSFQNRRVIPHGCNPSFIALIPKVNDPRFTYDFQPISLIGCQYKIIRKLLANRLATVIDSIVSPEQSAFIKGRQILDGPMMLSEIIAHFKATRRKLMVFKVDFEKAYDSLSWDFLFEVMNKMGFTLNWIAWVKATLTSSRASVLLNGAPTEEFDVQRGLRQGDPLSPFLFVLAMEGFHVGISEAYRAGVFQGVSIGSSDIRISHLLYADDAILLCDWGVQNARQIIRMLRVFQLASGLKINLNKSKLIGIGVGLIEVQQVAEMIGCCAVRLPFIYLGVPMRCNMNRIDSWKPMVDKFNKKLSCWKAKLLSIGGRLTLLKSVMGSLAIYYMSIYKVPATVLKLLESLRARFFWGADLGERKLHWIAWNRVLSSRDSGGLGVGSLAAFNKALLFKWKWRLRDNPNALWVRLVTSIHGEGGTRSSSRYGAMSPWVNIERAMKQLEVKGFHTDNFYRIKVEIGDKTSFWRDQWLGDRPLIEQFMRLFPLDPDPDAKVVERNSPEKLLATFGREPQSSIPNSQWSTLQGALQEFIFSEVPDRVTWDLDESGVFSVSSMRSCLDAFLLGSSGVPTRWNTLALRKLNILLWRILRDKIPTRLNVSDKGIDLDSLLCPVCMQTGESTEHLFSSCPDLCPLWHRIAVWWG
ncbi:RNA-directed DNA polymerase, eukaryota, reverse transcriptase zinc-binding domain protein, partial [Tanacetum coccineum]